MRTYDEEQYLERIAICMESGLDFDYALAIATKEMTDKGYLFDYLSSNLEMYNAIKEQDDTK